MVFGLVVLSPGGFEKERINHRGGQRYETFFLITKKNKRMRKREGAKGKEQRNPHICGLFYVQKKTRQEKRRKKRARENPRRNDFSLGVGNTGFRKKGNLCKEVAKRVCLLRRKGRKRQRKTEYGCGETWGGHNCLWGGFVLGGPWRLVWWGGEIRGDEIVFSTTMSQGQNWGPLDTTDRCS